ncbi:mRNA interferase HigB [Faunimonas pinastri]|uniref:mRNA interferase HigB n=1 Tax=Faunimonas pinastri TaxID=1855383 RepID=A0A1H9QBD3_9HYPH|nr:type II toxin-antitoxin system HigB family toxin [Faunimonas pinastri]SER57485.1 mRNA interferase HigB [Faunimonas pinastri]
MDVVARSTLHRFMIQHADAAASASYWLTVTTAAKWQSMNDVSQSFSKAKVIDAKRVRFEIGSQYRLIAGVDFRRQKLFIKFIGTHAEYDAVDAATVSMF